VEAAAEDEDSIKAVSTPASFWLSSQQDVQLPRVDVMAEDEPGGEDVLLDAPRG
jgi:hypothetical protein